MGLTLNRERFIRAQALRAIAAKAPHLEILLECLHGASNEEKEYARDFIRQEWRELHERAAALESAYALALAQEQQAQQQEKIA